MVTRINRSSKSRTGKDYMLLWRLSKVVGWNVIQRAINGDERALNRIESYAWRDKKKPALVKWLDQQRKK